MWLLIDGFCCVLGLQFGHNWDFTRCCIIIVQKLVFPSIYNGKGFKMAKGYSLFTVYISRTNLWWIKPRILKEMRIILLFEQLLRDFSNSIYECGIHMTKDVTELFIKKFSSSKDAFQGHNIYQNRRDDWRELSNTSTSIFESRFLDVFEVLFN